jgi:hypothetical protein
MADNNAFLLPVKVEELRVADGETLRQKVGTTIPMVWRFSGFEKDGVLKIWENRSTYATQERFVSKCQRAIQLLRASGDDDVVDYSWHDLGLAAWYVPTLDKAVLINDGWHLASKQ